VAGRKAARLIEAGATRLRMVAPEFDPDPPPVVEKIKAPYASAHLDGAGLVFAATDSPEVNAAVVRDARARRILVARADADEADGGDFITPAKFQDGPAIVTVSAGSPALAVMIRDALVGHWDKRWSMMAQAMQIIRPEIVSKAQLTRAQRADIFRRLAGEEALDVLESRGPGGLRDWLSQEYPSLKQG
jgi:precorrin-2 dehydrogenase/sirohydrochlorin ferrochelatase